MDFGVIMMIHNLTIVSNNILYDEREGVAKGVVIGELILSALPIFVLK